MKKSNTISKALAYAKANKIKTGDIVQFSKDNEQAINAFSANTETDDLNDLSKFGKSEISELLEHANKLIADNAAKAEANKAKAEAETKEKAEAIKAKHAAQVAKYSALAQTSRVSPNYSAIFANEFGIPDTLYLSGKKVWAFRGPSATELSMISIDLSDIASNGVDYYVTGDKKGFKFSHKQIQNLKHIERSLAFGQCAIG